MSEKSKEEQTENPFAHYGIPPWGYPPYWMHPAYGGMHPHMMPPSMHPHMMQGHMGYPPQMQQPQPDPEPNPFEEQMMAQAQQMLEGAMGEEAGLFKQIMGTVGMDDKEFWKGAMIGAGVALLLSNDKVRGSLMNMLSGAGDMLKTGGASVKDAATETASNVKESVNTGSEIFRDTVNAGKQGFQESVERHKAQPTDPEAESATSE